MTAVDREQRQDFVGTAAEHTHARIPVFAPDVTVRAVRASLAGRRFDSVADVAVCRGTRLVGLARIEDVLAAADDTLLSTLMDPDPPVVAAGTDQEVAAWHAVQRGACSVAVVDRDGVFRGLVPPRRLVQVLLEEHEEDLARLGGFLHGTRDARRAIEEPIRRRFWHRLPWLLVGLAGAMLAAGIVGGFEDKITRNVTLAFFLPGIVYMADAVGTQTETLVIRGLSVGVSVRRVVRREIGTGLLVGVTLAGAFFPFTLLYGDPGVALAASLALFAACSVATLIAMTLPLLLSRLGRDPAFGSGPLATVVQDLFSIVVYFALALWLVAYHVNRSGARSRRAQAAAAERRPPGTTVLMWCGRRIGVTVRKPTRPSHKRFGLRDRNGQPLSPSTRTRSSSLLGVSLADRGPASVETGPVAYGCGESPVDYRDDELDLVEDGPGDLRDPDDD